MATSRKRVIIADDHSLMAEGIARILSAAYEIVATVADGRELLAKAAVLRPDIVSLDIGMPSLNGLQAAVELHRLYPRMKLVFVTQQLEQPYLRAAFRAGASAYVSKQSAGTELLKAMQAVVAGKTYTTPLLTSANAHEIASLQPDLGKVFTDVLSARQREILKLIAEGRTAKEISSILHISVKTAEFHKGCIMDELGLRTTAELTRYALRHKLVAPSVEILEDSSRKCSTSSKYS